MNGRGCLFDRRDAVVVLLLFKVLKGTKWLTLLYKAVYALLPSQVVVLSALLCGITSAMLTLMITQYVAAERMSNNMCSLYINLLMLHTSGMNNSMVDMLCLWSI
jgi:hypothetical protein